MRFTIPALIAASLTFAAAAKSPACDLVTMDEAAAAFGTAITAVEPTAEKAGSSNCMWGTAESGVWINFGMLRGEGFAGGAPEDSFQAMASSIGMGAPLENLDGIGDKAVIVTPRGEPESRFSILVLKGGVLLWIGSDGIAREAIVTLATEAAGRM